MVQSIVFFFRSDNYQSFVLHSAWKKSHWPNHLDTYAATWNSVIGADESTVKDVEHLASWQLSVNTRLPPAPEIGNHRPTRLAPLGWVGATLSKPYTLEAVYSRSRINIPECETILLTQRRCSRCVCLVYLIIPTSLTKVFGVLCSRNVSQLLVIDLDGLHPSRLVAVVFFRRCYK